MGKTNVDDLVSPGGIEAGSADVVESELETIDDVVAGTATASKAVVLDSNKDVRGIGVGRKVTAAAADGAIAVKNGAVVITKAGVCALTLADPTNVTDDGCELLIIASTAHAHTVSNAAGSGFNAGGAGADVATFGGARGDNIMLLAYGGKWHVTNSVNVTLG
jgi:hypothetical protein